MASCSPSSSCCQARSRRARGTVSPAAWSAPTGSTRSARSCTLASTSRAVGRGPFTTVTTWQDGARARTTARSFTIETDEPAPLGGTDAAVDPMELVLAAVGTCLNIGWVTQARKRGIDYRNLQIEVSGNY